MMLLLAAVAAQTLADNRYAIDEPLGVPALVWADEFDGPGLDATKWVYETEFNKRGWHNKELQYYSAGRPENLRIEDGKLVIELRRDPEAIQRLPDWGGQKYSSARIRNPASVGFTYGFYEIRAKLPCTRGIWPAIWMLPVKP